MSTPAFRCWLICLCALLWPTLLPAQPLPGESYQYFLSDARSAIAARNYVKAERSLLSAIQEADAAGMPRKTVPMLLRQLAAVYSWQGKYAAADEQLRVASEILQEQRDGAALAAVARQRAEFFTRQQKSDEAEQALRQGVELVEAAGNEQSSALLSALNALADHYRAAGREAQAEPLRRRALAIAEQAEQREKGALARQEMLLADCYRRQQKYALAVPLCRQAIARLQQCPPPDPYPLVNALATLARCADEQQQSDNARQHYRDAVAALEDFFGVESPSLVRHFARIAAAHQQAGRLDEAATLLLRTRAIAEAVYGSSEETAKILDQYAELLKQQGKTAEAAQAAATAKTMREPRK